MIRRIVIPRIAVMAARSGTDGAAQIDMMLLRLAVGL